MDSNTAANDPVTVSIRGPVTSWTPAHGEYTVDLVSSNDGYAYVAPAPLSAEQLAAEIDALDNFKL